MLNLSTDSPTDSKCTGFTFRGKEIVLQKAAGRPPQGLVRKGMERGIYPEKKKLEAVGLYAALGQVKKVAEIAKVPVHTIQNWRKQQWFQDCLREIREENNEKLDAKFTEIIEEALEQVTDRVRNGDFTQNAKGEVVRRPISAKDLSLVVAINYDKRALGRGDPTSRTEQTGNVTEKTVDRLEKLAETFENLAKHGRRKVEVIDIEEIKPHAITDATQTPGNKPDEEGKVLNGAPEARTISNS